MDRSGTKLTDYYMGLDIGTSSVGWAVTDSDYNILEYRRKALWGVHLFDEGKTASERRMHRCARRRLNRRKQRIALLRELFDKEICDVDPSFFERLDESNLKLEDRNSGQPNSLFNDPDFTDRDFHSRFPTIYHLRRFLMDTNEKPDIRLVYLAVHHIVKYRGHFLFSGISSGEIPSFEDVIGLLLDDIDKYGMDLRTQDLSRISDILSDRNLGISDKKRLLNEAFGCETKQEKELVSLLSGGKTKLDVLFGDDNLKGMGLSLSDAAAEDKLLEMEDELDEDSMITIRLAKKLYDWSVLSSILKGFDSISEAKISIYDRHSEDLKFLKKAVRQYAPDKYRDVFKAGDKTHVGNYCSYSGVCGKGKPEKTCDQEDFCKYCRKILSGTGIENDPEFADMMDRLTNGDFMPKQSSKDNSVLPYTVHRRELRAILDNAARFHTFLEEVGEDGFTVAEKIMKLQEFRVPYYVGPLSPTSPRSWAVRKNSDRITPWNFEDSVDTEASAEGFMENLTSTCTYMIGEKVLPRNAPTYLYFQLYNELNNIRINGERMAVGLKKEMVRDLFEDPSRKGRVTVNTIKKYLVQRGVVEKKDPVEITGIDGDVKSTLRPYLSMKTILGEKAGSMELCDEISRIITIFEDGRQVRSRLGKVLGDKLSESDISSLSKLSMEGWGRLSRRFLTGLRVMCPDLGREACILDIMENTQYNLMETYHRFGFDKLVDNHNESMTSDGEVTYDDIDALYVSPAVKRGIWRTVCVVKDVVEHLGHPPRKVFVETTRQVTDPADRKRTESRKDHLVQLYKACREDVQLLDDLNSRSESDLKSRSLYLYYTQKGRCMYCGAKIDIESLGNKEIVDRDHIYPQSVIKDDSIHNNMVLACRKCNAAKSNTYPIPAEWQMRMRPLWDELLEKKYIRPEKYSRLVRTEGFSQDELARFINRQLVETSQSVKGAISILKRMFGSETEIVFVKAGTVSDFRQYCDSPITAKCRMLNDLHHAKDAYLNIVVGNVYNTKFTKDVIRFLGTHETYNIGKMYERPVSRNGMTAWIPGDEGTIKTVLKNMRRDNVLFTKYPFIQKGQLFDDNPLRAKDTLLDKKRDLPAKKYGGYDNVKGACYSLVEYRVKDKKVRSLEPVPIMELKLLNDERALSQYFSRTLQNDVRVLIPVIRMNTLIEMNGFRMHVAGRTGNSIVFYPAVQLLVPDEWMMYIRRLSKMDQDRKDKIVRTAGYYGITSECNMGLFDYLLDKCGMRPYSEMFGALRKNLETVRNSFADAETDIQAEVLVQILYSFQCNATSTCLTKVGGVGLTGRIVLNKKMGTGNVSIIDQSCSGLSENIRRIS